MSITYDRFQALPNLQPPFIVDDSFDPRVAIGEQFLQQLQEGYQFSPMSSLDKVGQAGYIDFQNPAVSHNPMFYAPFPEVPYQVHPLLQAGEKHIVHDGDFHYQSGNEYPSDKSFENEGPVFVDTKPQYRNEPLRGLNNAHQRGRSTHSVLSNARKRKASVDSGLDLAPAQKKVTLAQVNVQDPNGDYYYDLSGQTSPYSTFVPTPTNSTGFPACIPRGTSPRPSGHHYSTSTASQVSLAAPSPHTPAFSPSFTAVKSEQSPGAPMTPLPRPSSTCSPSKSVPKLVRTSTIHQSPHGLMANMSVGQTQNFNPYAMYPLKADLKLQGDLESMKLNWTFEEKEARRRLVEFKRTQHESTIHAEFNPVTPQDRSPSSICISCIWWKERNEFFVTSVDTIYLLEALVGVRFTVEEKNRIRRNLEGFRPMTVSKTKPDSEEFFKVIMGFPHPKPRNIEKDVKVFPWKILTTALQKIISKYSASYSSTASALLTPSVNSFSGGDGAMDFYDSSRFDYVPTMGAQYQPAGDMGYVTGPPQLRMNMPIPVQQVPDLQLQMPDYAQQYAVQEHYVYNDMPQVNQVNMSMPAHPMTAPPTRMQSFDFGNFVNDSPVTMAPHSAPPTAYPPGSFEERRFIPAMHYQSN